VLIVENDEDTRQMYAEWLTFSGFRVVEAKDGAEAIEKARNLKPDVITTDIWAAGWHGRLPAYGKSEILRAHEQDSDHRRDGVGDGRARGTRPKSGL
jgi:CheY-like chemotaxis protein